MIPRLAGIVNLTPDSFSDGGQYTEADRAIQQIESLIEAGADMIDIGAESTRPGAILLSPQEEWERLYPVLCRLPRHTSVVYSLDTRHAETAQKSFDHGITLINDVSGAADTALLSVVAANPAISYVLMHSLGVPADPRKILPEDKDAAAQVYEFAEQKIAMLDELGIYRNRLIFDPGIGFGKTARQSLDIVVNIALFKRLKVPLMVGHSRKSFLTSFTDAPATGRDAATLAVSHFLAGEGVDYLRVHDVAGHRAAFAAWEKLHV
jgi:dihydropteroate synthase